MHDSKFNMARPERGAYLLLLVLLVVPCVGLARLAQASETRLKEVTVTSTRTERPVDDAPCDVATSASAWTPL